jgi:outer membrane lipoprotein-sorting protein
MRTARRAAIAFVAAAILTAASALAQPAPVPPASIPVPQPKPAPQPKSGSAGPPPSAGASTPLPLAPVGQPLPKVAVPASPTLIPGGTTAFDNNQRALIERVNTYLTGVQTMMGDFVQVAADGSRTEGKFYLQKPGKVRFEYNPPSPVELIADGQSLVVRDRKLATQDLYPLSQTPLRFLLADRIDLMKDTNLAAVYADNLFVSIVIEERQVFGGTHRLMLMFGAKDFELKQWTITDPQGYDTTVAVYNLDKSKKLDPGLFKINYERMLQ